VKSKASKKASAPCEGQQLSDDDVLLEIIEGWASLPAARKKMILAIVAARREKTHLGDQQ
jgi:hypothetical protein